MIGVDQRSSSPSEVHVVGLAARSFAVEAAKHPVLIGGAIASAALIATTLFRGATVWQDLTVLLGGALLPLVGAAFLVGYSNVSREIHYAYEEHSDSLPHGRSIRTLGMAGGMLAPLGYGVLLIVVSSVLASFFLPAGVILWAEHVTALLAIAVAWLAGMVLGSSQRFRLAPVFALLAYTVVHYLVGPDISIGASQGNTGPDFSRLLLWMPTGAFDTPFDTLLRPSPQRVVFLATGFLLLGSILNARTQTRLRASSALPILVASLAVGVTASFILSWEPDEPWAMSGLAERPVVDFQALEPFQECTGRDQISICTYPGFASWAPDWMSTVEESRATVFPAQISTIVQRPENVEFPGSDPGPQGVVSFFDWDRPGTNRPIERFALVSRVGQTMVGFPYASDRLCDGRGQGRSVFALWLAAALGSRERAVLADLSSQQGAIWTAEGARLGAAVVDNAAADLALHLTELPREDVERGFEEGWDELIDPSVTLLDVAAWFGTAPSEVLESINSAPEPGTSPFIPRCG